MEWFELIEQRITGSRSQVGLFTIGTKGKNTTKIRVKLPCLGFFTCTGDRPFIIAAADVAGSADRAR